VRKALYLPLFERGENWRWQSCSSVDRAWILCAICVEITEDSNSLQGRTALFVFSHLPKPLPAAAFAVRLAREPVRALALEAGFTDAGLLALPYAHESRDAARFEEWARSGRAATMRYLERTDEQGRLLRAQIPFSWARSVVVCLASYDSRQPHSTELAAKDKGWIARYAWSSKMDAAGTRRPSDYHKVLLKRMKAVEAGLHEQFGEFAARAYVDTGPVMEKALAVAAGLGWTGKNTCLIHPHWGSYGFLAVLLTSLPVQEEEEQSALPEGCGRCRRCLDACPTGALIAPHQMDATRCIAYLSIEHRGAIAPELMGRMGRQVFGCDICQDVCPWNRKITSRTKSEDAELRARPELVNPPLEWLASMDEEEFERQFNGSPLRRTGFLGLRRNVAIAMGNSGMSCFIPWLEKWALEPCDGIAGEGVQTAARWALAKLRSRAADL
jgi:epoxyqueuosine reductase